MGAGRILMNSLLYWLWIYQLLGIDIKIRLAPMVLSISWYLISKLLISFIITS